MIDFLWARFKAFSFRRKVSFSLVKEAVDILIVVKVFMYLCYTNLQDIIYGYKKDH